jgi:hypothetical protein
MSGCLGVENQESVIVKVVPADLAFGKPASNAAPRPGPVPAPIPSLAGSTILNPGFYFSGGPAPIQGCFAPGPGVFPEDPATADSDAAPTAGTYIFRSSGSLAGVKSAPSKMTRVIHRVTVVPEPTNSGVFTYQDDGGFGFEFADPQLAAAFTVRPNSTDSANVVPIPQAPGAPSPAPNDQVGSSPDGVYITYLSFTLPGRREFRFSSPAGVQLLQLPALNRQQWSSSAADSAGDGTSISFTGGINPTADPGSTGKEYVDGCGQVFDTWRVDGTMVLTAPSDVIQDKVSLYFATQYGGWLVREHHVVTLDGAPAGDFYVALDTLPPGPLPRGVS